MPRARCCSTSPRPPGMTNCAAISTCPRASAAGRCDPARPTSASRRLSIFCRTACRFAAWPATSRRPCSVSAPSLPARRNAPTAPGLSFCNISATSRRCRVIDLLTTLAASGDGPPQYALEGSVFVAGAAVQWLRDGLKLFDAAPAIEELAARSDPEQPVIFVPGFVGLGAPHWLPEARGVLVRPDARHHGGRREPGDAGRRRISGRRPYRRRGSRRRDAACISCESTAAWLAMRGFSSARPTRSVMPVVQTSHSEATALGAAYLAGLSGGVWPDLDALRRLDAEARRFEPRLDEAKRQQRHRQWQRAVQAVIQFYT